MTKTLEEIPIALPVEGSLPTDPAIESKIHEAIALLSSAHRDIKRTAK